MCPKFNCDAKQTLEIRVERKQNNHRSNLSWNWMVTMNKLKNWKLRSKTCAFFASRFTGFLGKNLIRPLILLFLRSKTCTFLPVDLPDFQKKNLNRPLILLFLRSKTCGFFASRFTWFSEKNATWPFYILVTWLVSRFARNSSLHSKKIGPYKHGIG